MERDSALIGMHDRTIDDLAGRPDHSFVRASVEHRRDKCSRAERRLLAQAPED